MAAVTETTHEAAPTESHSTPTETLAEQMCKEFERFRDCCEELDSPNKWTGDDVLFWYKTVGSKHFANIAMVGQYSRFQLLRWSVSASSLLLVSLLVCAAQSDGSRLPTFTDFFIQTLTRRT